MATTHRGSRHSSTIAKIITLTGRNVRLYFIDRTSVFFSLLGAVIAILVVILFMKNDIVNTMTTSSQGLVTRESASRLMDTWLVASACVIASATTGLGAMRQYASDRESQRWRDFLVSPISPWALTLGYIAAAFLVSAIMTTLIYALGVLYCLTGGCEVSTSHILQTWGWLMLCSGSFTALMGFLVSLLRTLAAFSAVSTVIGVVFGFFAETYVHVGALSSTVASVLGSLPFAQASALVRYSFTADEITNLDPRVHEATRADMGIELAVGGHDITRALIVLILVAMLMVFTALAATSISRTVRRS